MKRVLLIAPQWLGDAVMTHSLIQMLAKEAHVDVLCVDWIKPIYDSMEGVKKTIPMALVHGQFQMKLYWKMAQSLKNIYDQCYIVPRKLKSALIPWLANIPKRTAYLGESRYGLVNDRVDKNQEHSLWVQQVCALYDADIASKKSYPQPKLMVNQVNQKHWIERLGLIDKKLICLMPGASYGPSKQWPIQSFKETAHELSNNAIVVVLGGDKEKVLGERIKDSHENIINLCAKTTLNDTIDLLGMSDYCVTNDSGLMHIAAATGCFVKALYGSSSPEYTPPLTQNKQIFSDKLACKPCFKRTCEFNHYDCWKQITPKRVMASDES